MIKNLFPSEWQEIHHRAIHGEVHIADVKTGMVHYMSHYIVLQITRESHSAVNFNGPVAGSYIPYTSTKPLLEPKKAL